MTRRNTKEREREPGESEDPSQSIQSPNPYESPLSPQLDLTPNFCWEKGKSERESQRDHLRTKSRIVENAKIMKKTIPVHYN